MQKTRPILVLVAAFAALVGSGCGNEKVQRAQHSLRTEDVPRVAAMIRDDKNHHLVGVNKAAAILAPYLAVQDVPARDAAMCPLLNNLRRPPRGIAEFVVSPMSFLAIIGADGKVICRDGENDRMKGMAFAANYASVREAMQSGRATYQLAEFQAEGGGESSLTMLFVAPIRKDGQTIGAVATGIPLPREAQRISRQLRLEKAAEINQGLVLWAYLYRGDRLFHFGTAPEIDEVVPRGDVIRQGLQRSPNGFVGSFPLHGVDYAYGVIPAPSIGEGVSLILVRSAR